MNKYTNLTSGSSSFKEAMSNGFGIITVMDARVYDAPSVDELANKTAYQVLSSYANENPLCTLDTLKIANVNQDGPTKTITGGKYSNPLIKFGKSARLEIQDALGSAHAIDALCGGVREWKGESQTTGLHFGEDFQGPKLIIGDTFIIDRKTGQQVAVNIIFYQFLPDSIFNLTQDAEGDATVFDMNGDLLTTLIKVGTPDAGEMTHGVFYSIVDPNHIIQFVEYNSTYANPEIGLESEYVVLTPLHKHTGIIDASSIQVGGIISTRITTGNGTIPTTTTVTKNNIYWREENGTGYNDLASLSSEEEITIKFLVKLDSGEVLDTDNTRTSVSIQYKTTV